MPFLWNQPPLSWGIDISTDQMHVIALRDAIPQPQLCHEFSVAAPNAFNLPAHLNNPMAMGKTLAEVLQARAVRHGQCYFSVPHVQVQHMRIAQGHQTAKLAQHIHDHLQHKEAKPWAFDFVTQDAECMVVYCHQSLLDDYALLASYMPLHVSAVEPEASAVERAVRGFFPACVQAAWVVLVLTPRGCLWQAYTNQALRYTADEPWRIASEALPFTGWLSLQEDLRRGYAELIKAHSDASKFSVLLAGAWATEPELQALVQAIVMQPTTLADTVHCLSPSETGLAELQSQPAKHTVPAQYMLALGLALRGCRHAPV